MEIEYDSTEIQYDFSQGKRGAIDPVGARKTHITIQIDDNMLEWFREQVHQAGEGTIKLCQMRHCDRIFDRNMSR
jgi:uncharacterized protein (DUF4415 family)